VPAHLAALFTEGWPLAAHSTSNGKHYHFVQLGLVYVVHVVARRRQIDPPDTTYSSYSVRPADVRKSAEPFEGIGKFALEKFWR
jgi:hypothetical protein